MSPKVLEIVETFWSTNLMIIRTMVEWLRPHLFNFTYFNLFNYFAAQIALCLFSRQNVFPKLRRNVVNINKAQHQNGLLLFEKKINFYVFIDTY